MVQRASAGEPAVPDCTLPRFALISLPPWLTFSRLSTRSAGAENMIQFRPIGVIHTPFLGVPGTPIQPAATTGVAGTVELAPEYAAALEGLDGFSHVFLIYHFHLVRETRLKVVPFLDTVQHGLFATRAPCRPNPIGLSLVRLVAVEGSSLRVLDVDVIDGTPLLDVKPYCGEFDQAAHVRRGWLEGACRRVQGTLADDRFEDKSSH